VWLLQRIHSPLRQGGSLPNQILNGHNSPLEKRKVRLRGLGGQTVCGVPGTCASAIGSRPVTPFHLHPFTPSPLHPIAISRYLPRLFPLEAAIS
jgi:hypothetical protein